MPSGRDDDGGRSVEPNGDDAAPTDGITAILMREGVHESIIAEVRAAIEAAKVFVPDKVPPFRDKKGKVDTDHFRIQIQNLINENAHLQRIGKRGLANFVAMRDSVFRSAKMAGIDPKGLLDERAVDERSQETAMRMLNAPLSAFESLDDEIDHLEQSFISAVEGAGQVLDEIEDRHRKEAEGIRRQGKVWLRRLARIRRLREATRKPVPERSDPIVGAPRFPSLKTTNHLAWAASRVLRTLCYVYRSDRSDVHPIFSIGPHHCKMAVDIYLARHRMRYLIEGTPEECEEHPHLFAPVGKAGWRRGVSNCRGIVVLVPPRHTKSMVGSAFMVEAFNDNPRTQAKMAHAIDDQCATNMRFVKSAFDPNEPQGRRNLSLFPAKFADTDNGKGKMRLVNAEPTRDPQLTAKGITGGVGGQNADLIWFDDPVDPKQVTEDTTRQKTTTLITGQWLRRLQGDDSFVLITATPWHPDDAVMTIVQGARAGEWDYAVSRQPVGGPNQAEKDKLAGRPPRPDFFSIWDGQPTSAIRRAYKEINDPWAFSCQFQLDPTPESSLVIKQIALYVAEVSGCPEPPAEMVERWKLGAAFFRTAEGHLSLDPSSTSEDKQRELLAQGGGRRDQSGLVYLMQGMCQDLIDGQIVSRLRVRVVNAKRFYASPGEAVVELGNFCRGNKVDVVHIEEVTGFVAISEQMRNEYGLSNSQIVGHKTGNRSKRARLKAVSSMLDDSFQKRGLEPAVVEFPGVLNEDGRLVADPAFAWFTDSILRFGFTKEDHGVDALTQVLQFLAPVVGVGTSGSVTLAVQAAEEVPTDAQRRREALREAYRSAKKETFQTVGAAFA